MKIALCFSGQPRFVAECSEYIKANVIRNYDVDVLHIFGLMMIFKPNHTNMVEMETGLIKELKVMLLMISSRFIIQFL